MVGVNRTALILVCVAIGLLGGSGLMAPNVRAAPGPTLSIVSPANNAIVGDGSPVAIVFAVTNFNLTEPDAGPSTPDSGHAAVLVDGGFAETSSTNTVVIPLPSGPHTLTLELIDNGGQSLTPAVAATLHISVRALLGRVQPFDATPYFALANVLLGLGIVAAIYRKLEVD